MDEPINRYPDEPHPDDEHAWKRWWVQKTYRPEQMMTEGDIEFIHRCWVETKSRWNIEHVYDEGYLLLQEKV